MQTQQQKPTKQISSPKQRLSAGEVVIGILNLLFSGAFSILFYGLAFTDITHVWQDYVAGAVMAVAMLGTAITALFVALRQRSLAAYAQWFSAFCIIAFIGVIAVTVIQNHHGDKEAWKEILSYTPLLFFPLLLAWFAWFLKRLDD